MAYYMHEWISEDGDYRTRVSTMKFDEKQLRDFYSDDGGVVVGSLQVMTYEAWRARRSDDLHLVH